MLIVGIVVLSGQVTDDSSAQILFAVWMLVEGVLAFRSEWLDIMESDSDQKIGVTLCTLMLIVGGYDEKLMEAHEDENRALAKAKEGIREQKHAQRRIAKIKADMAAEQDIMMSAAITRQEREAERESAE